MKLAKNLSAYVAIFLAWGASSVVVWVIPLVIVGYLVRIGVVSRPWARENWDLISRFCFGISYFVGGFTCAWTAHRFQKLDFFVWLFRLMFFVLAGTTILAAALVGLAPTFAQDALHESWPSVLKKLSNWFDWSMMLLGLTLFSRRVDREPDELPNSSIITS